MADGVVAAPDGVPIAYEVHGAGPPALVLVHGWSCDRTYWRGQLEPLSRDFRVVAIDLAGHGESGLEREAWTIEAFGADVATVVGELELDRVILIGHSMGGDVVLEAARRLRGRVAALIWLDTYSHLGSPRTADQVEAILDPFRADLAGATRELVRGLFPADAEESLVEWVAADMAAAPRAVALGALESSFTYGRTVTTPLQELGLPVVAINPESPSTDVSSMERYGVEVVLMSHVGHFLMLEDPQRFNRLLSDVVKRFAS